MGTFGKSAHICMPEQKVFKLRHHFDYQTIIFQALDQGGKIVKILTNAYGQACGWVPCLCLWDSWHLERRKRNWRPGWSCWKFILQVDHLRWQQNSVPDQAFEMTYERRSRRWFPPSSSPRNPPNPFRIVSILRHLISPPLNTTKHHGFHTQMPQVLEEQTHIWEHVAWRDWQNVENQD